jgi:hypothetical protein
VRASGGTSLLPNNDAHIAIEYFNVNAGTQTLCGRYRVTGAAFVGAGGYSQATCVIPGNLVRVTLTNSYSLVTGLLGGGVGAAVTVTADAVMPVMV